MHSVQVSKLSLPNQEKHLIDSKDRITGISKSTRADTKVENPKSFHFSFIPNTTMIQEVEFNVKMIRSTKLIILTTAKPLPTIFYNNLLIFQV